LNHLRALVDARIARVSIPPMEHLASILAAAKAHPVQTSPTSQHSERFSSAPSLPSGFTPTQLTSVLASEGSEYAPPNCSPLPIYPSPQTSASYIAPLQRTDTLLDEVKLPLDDVKKDDSGTAGVAVDRPYDDDSDMDIDPIPMPAPSGSHPFDLDRFIGIDSTSLLRGRLEMDMGTASLGAAAVTGHNQPAINREDDEVKGSLIELEGTGSSRYPVSVHMAFLIYSWAIGMDLIVIVETSHIF